MMSAHCKEPEDSLIPVVAPSLFFRQEVGLLVAGMAFDVDYEGI